MFISDTRQEDGTLRWLLISLPKETGTISFAKDGKLRKIPRKELRASLVNELNWFKTKEKGGENDVKKR